jgi:hypothetical protein
MALTGDLDDASRVIEDCVARIEAGEERSHYAEVLRLKGWILMLCGERERAASTLEQALSWRGASRLNHGSCARRRRSPGCWQAAVNRRERSKS